MLSNVIQRCFELTHIWACLCQHQDIQAFGSFYSQGKNQSRWPMDAFLHCSQHRENRKLRLYLDEDKWGLDLRKADKTRTLPEQRYNWKACLKPEAVSRETPLHPNDLIDRHYFNRQFLSWEPTTILWIISTKVFFYFLLALPGRPCVMVARGFFFAIFAYFFVICK